MEVIKRSTEAQLRALTVPQLKKICADVGMPYGRNRTITAIALKLKEREAEEEESSSDNSDSGSEEEGEEAPAQPSGATAGEAVLRRVMEELAAINRRVDTLTPASGSAGGVGQLVGLHDELLRERQAAKIYPDHDFEKERDQQEYDALKDVARLLSFVDAGVLPVEQRAKFAKALKRVEGRAAAVVVGSLEGWGTAAHIVGKEQSFLELRWKDEISEARRKWKAEEKGKGQSFFRSSRRRTSAGSQQKPPLLKSSAPPSTSAGWPSGNGKDLASVTCFGCRKTGHYSNRCPECKSSTSTL
jgi:hypothetical protein